MDSCSASSDHAKIDIGKILREREEKYKEQGWHSSCNWQEPYIMEVSSLFKNSQIMEVSSLFKNSQIMEVSCLFKNSAEKEKDFVPQMVGLGPYHHNKGSLTNQCSHKIDSVIRALKRMQAINGTGHNPQEEPLRHRPNDLERLREEIKGMESEIKCCYASEFEFSEDMFILDGCFVVETMLAAASVMSQFQDSYTNWITGRKFFMQRFSPVVWESLCLDFIKLENQIPLVVIEELMKIQGLDDYLPDIILGLYTTVSPLPSKVIHRSAVETMLKKSPRQGQPASKACVTSKSESGQQQPASKARVTPESESGQPNLLGRPGHFLDGLLQFTLSYILQMSVEDIYTIRIKHGTPPFEKGSKSKTKDATMCSPMRSPVAKLLVGEPQMFEEITLPTATELKRVNIKVKKGDKVSVRERCFDLFTTLTIPPILVKEHTPIVLQNLIVHELCPAVYGNTLTNYVTMIDNLINSKEDVEILKGGGVLDGSYGSDERLAEVFNTLARTVQSEYTDEWRTSITRIRSLYSQNTRTLFTEFYAQYLSRPWLVMATTAAIIILVCTIIQAVNS